MNSNLQFWLYDKSQVTPWYFWEPKAKELSNDDFLRNAFGISSKKPAKKAGIQIVKDLNKPKEEPNNKTFASRITDSFNNRTEQTKENEKSGRNFFRSKLDQLAVWAGTFSDIVWAVVGEWLETSGQIVSAITPDSVEDRVKRRTESVFNTVVESQPAEDLGNFLSTSWKAAKFVFDKLPEDAQKDIESLGSVWLWILDATWAAYARKVWVNVGWEIKKTAEGISEVRKEKQLIWKLNLETRPWLIDWVGVDIPVQNRWIVETLSTPLRESDTKVLAGRALSPKTVGKNDKQKLKSVQDVEKNTNQFYVNVRTGKLEGNINTIEDASQTVIDNLDTVGARIWNAVSQVEWTLNVDVDILDSINTAIKAKWSRVSGATPILKDFIEDLWDGELDFADAYELKKAYSNEVSKLYKSWDAGTKQFKALSDWVNYLNNEIDLVIDTKLWTQFADDKLLFRNLKLIVDDIVSSTLVEGRRSPNTLAEQIGMIEGLLSPLQATKQIFIKEIGELNTRWWAWKELIKIYDKRAIKNK